MDKTTHYALTRGRAVWSCERWELRQHRLCVVPTSLEKRICMCTHGRWRCDRCGLKIKTGGSHYKYTHRLFICYEALRDRLRRRTRHSFLGGHGGHLKATCNEWIVYFVLVLCSAFFSIGTYSNCEPTIFPLKRFLISS